ncbi:MAG: hypothetical protein Q9N67_00545 [Ghiorsea sp.]|nr:hypothetical protein [Ghiorsea sp.]
MTNLMVWSYQYLIADVVVQVESDSVACETGMQKFLCLYEPVQGKNADLIFRIRHQDQQFVFTLHANHAEEVLWMSDDADEVTAALEIHLYSKLVQFLNMKNILSIHSAVLHIDGAAIMFAGVSGAGKSSMCTAALLDGAAYLSDEFTLLDADGFVHPFPRPMQWEHPLHPAFDRNAIEKTGLMRADYFDFPDAQGNTARCHLWYPTSIQRQPLLLTMIVLHQYKADIASVECFEIPRFEGLSALPEHLHMQYGMAIDLPKLNQRIDKSCKFYRLHFPNVTDAWQVMKAKIS